MIIEFTGRVSGKLYISNRVGFCEHGSETCGGVFFTKDGFVHYELARDISVSVADIYTWMADPQNDCLRARGDDQWLAMLKLESVLAEG